MLAPVLNEDCLIYVVVVHLEEQQFDRLEPGRRGVAVGVYRKHAKYRVGAGS